MCVTLHRQVEAPELVAGERVGATLEDDGGGLVHIEDLGYNLYVAEDSASNPSQ